MVNATVNYGKSIYHALKVEAITRDKYDEYHVEARSRSPHAMDSRIRCA